MRYEGFELLRYLKEHSQDSSEFKKEMYKLSKEDAIRLAAEIQSKEIKSVQ